MPSRESRRVASALPGAAALLISAWCWTAIPAAAKVRRNAPKTGHSGPLLMDGPVRENCSVTVFWDLDNLMPCSNVSLRSYCRALARRFVGPAQFRLYANMRTRERLYLAQGSGAEPRFCFDDAPKIEFDGTDNIPSNADDLLSIVQGRPNALAVAVSKRDQQKLRSWAKAAGLFLHVPGDKDRAGDTQRRVLYDWRSYLASFNAQITVVPATFQSADQAIHHAVLREINDPKHRASRGVLCVISNDVDFLETLKAARRNGWKTATVCSSESRLRHGRSIGWSNCCELAAQQPCQADDLEIFCNNPARKRRPTPC